MSTYRVVRLGGRSGRARLELCAGREFQESLDSFNRLLKRAVGGVTPPEHEAVVLEREDTGTVMLRASVRELWTAASELRVTAERERHREDGLGRLAGAE